MLCTLRTGMFTSAANLIIKKWYLLKKKPRGIYGADYQPDRLPAENITHVLYSFADIGSDGEV